MVEPKFAAVLALLAALPIAAYMTVNGMLFVAVAFLNVALIAGSVWYLLGGGEERTGALPG